MTKLNGNPLGRSIIITLDKEKVTKSSLILNATDVKGGDGGGGLKERQTVVAVGPYCDQVLVGDEVMIDFDKFKKTVPEDRLAGDHVKKTFFAINTIEFDEVTYGRMSEMDVIWVYGKA